jgi:hypothetical protein
MWAATLRVRLSSWGHDENSAARISSYAVSVSEIDWSMRRWSSMITPSGVRPWRVKAMRPGPSTWVASTLISYEDLLDLEGCCPVSVSAIYGYGAHEIAPLMGGAGLRPTPAR